MFSKLYHDHEINKIFGRFALTVRSSRLEVKKCDLEETAPELSFLHYYTILQVSAGVLNSLHLLVILSSVKMAVLLILLKLS